MELSRELAQALLNAKIARVAKGYTFGENAAVFIPAMVLVLSCLACLFFMGWAAAGMALHGIGRENVGLLVGCTLGLLGLVVIGGKAFQVWKRIVLAWSANRQGISL